MKDRILSLLIKNHPNHFSAVSIGTLLGADTEKDAVTSVLQPLDILIREKLVMFEFIKKDDNAHKEFYYSAVL